MKHSPYVLCWAKRMPCFTVEWYLIFNNAPWLSTALFMLSMFPNIYKAQLTDGLGKIMLRFMAWNFLKFLPILCSMKYYKIPSLPIPSHEKKKGKLASVFSIGFEMTEKSIWYWVILLLLGIFLKNKNHNSQWTTLGFTCKMTIGSTMQC